MPHDDFILAAPVSTLALAGLVLGAIVGSFLGAALVRLPDGRSVVRGRSQCDSCHRPLGAFELVPIVSYLLQHGRCRACGAQIGTWQFACEVLGAIVGALPWLIVPRAGLAVAGMVMGWQLVLLALLDLRHLWLPSRLTGILAASGIAAAVWTGWGGELGTRLSVSFSGGFFGWGVLALVAFAYRRTRGRDGMGRGDPPLLGAIGLWLGPLGVIEVLLGASIAGIIAAVAMMALRREVRGDTALPLGTCMAAAAWPLFLLQGFG